MLETWDDATLLAGLEAAREVDHTARFEPGGVADDQRLSLAQELDARGWVRVGKPLRGDGQLIEARGVVITNAGLQARSDLQESRTPSGEIGPDPREVWAMLRRHAPAGSSLAQRVSEVESELADRGMVNSGVARVRALELAAEHGLAWEASTRSLVPEWRLAPALTAEQGVVIDAAATRFVATGKWPEVGRVIRDGAQAGLRSADQVVASLPSTVAHVNGTALVLTAEGLAAAEDGAELLAPLVGMSRYAAQVYLGEADRPLAKSVDVHAALGLDEEAAARLRTLLATERFFLGSGHENEDGWEYEVTAAAADLIGCESVEQYLRVRREYTPSPTSRASMPDSSSSAIGHVDTRAAAIRRLGLQGLHPEVLAAASDLFTDAHYSSAIFEAFKALENRVRRQSGVDAYGRDLMAKAFSGQPPPVDLREFEGRSGASEQEGFRLLYMGAIQGIRNPKGHELVLQDDPQRSLEYLALASLLFRRLDDAQREDEEKGESSGS